MPSLLHFNGQLHGFQHGGIAVMLGVDGIARGEGTHPNIAPDLAHELFHLYQFEMHANVDPSVAPLWEGVYGEGSAAYASQRLTPGASKAGALLSSTLADLNMGKTKQLACGIKEKFGSRKNADFAAYLRGGVYPSTSLPDRGGYLIGYLIASDLGKRYSVAGLAKIAVRELEPQFRRRLQKLCTNGSLIDELR